MIELSIAKAWLNWKADRLRAKLRRSINFHRLGNKNNLPKQTDYLWGFNRCSSDRGEEKERKTSASARNRSTLGPVFSDSGGRSRKHLWARAGLRKSKVIESVTVPLRSLKRHFLTLWKVNWALESKHWTQLNYFFRKYKISSSDLHSDQ